MFRFNNNIKLLLSLFIPAICVFGIEYLNYSYLRQTLLILYTPLILVAILGISLPILFQFIFKKEYPIFINVCLFFIIWGLTCVKFPSLFLNFLIVLSLELMLLGISKRYDISLITTILFSGIIGQLNSYVIRFRGSAITWADLNAIKTAKNIFNNYDYSLTKSELIILGIYLIFVILIILNGKEKINLNIPGRFLSFGIGATIISLLLFTNVTQVIGVEGNLFYKQSNGLILNQLLTADKYILKLPEGYSISKIEEIASKIDAVENNTSETSPSNIIVIMNEAFSDIPFSKRIEIDNLKNLKENTISGTIYSSVFGGNTANSEYEFLTNNSMLFLNSALVPYTINIVKESSPSIVKDLKAEGYETIAFHPWLKSGWNRVNTYNNLGFDKQLFIEDFDSWDKYGEFPSDKWDYEQVINLYENKSSDKLFLFNITMQNHSPNENIIKSIEQCDEDIKILIDYFSNIEENTIIVFFGDHQFKMEDSFYKELLGKEIPELSKEEMEKLYEVPFFIWANYDIPEQEDVKTSLNFLSVMMLDTANINLNKYQIFLKDLYKKFPVIHSNGVWDNNGNYYESIESIPERDVLNKYKVLQYHSMLDTKNLKLELFN